MSIIQTRHQLGEYEGMYTYRDDFLLRQCVLLFVCVGVSVLDVFVVLLFGLGIVQPSFYHSTFDWIAGSLFFSLGGIIILVSTAYYSVPALRRLLLFLREGAPTITVYTGGFVYAKKRSVEVVAWEQVDTVWQEVVLRPTRIKASLHGSRNSVKSHDIVYYYLHSGEHTYTTRSYTVRCTDGRTFWFDGAFSNVEALVDRIKERVVLRLLQQLLHSYYVEETLTFGELILNPQGLRWSKRFLPWNQFERFYLSGQNVLVLFKKGRFPAWKSLSLAKIPNVFVCLIVLRMRGQMQHLFTEYY